MYITIVKKRGNVHIQYRLLYWSLHKRNIIYIIILHLIILSFRLLRDNHIISSIIGDNDIIFGDNDIIFTM